MLKVYHIPIATCVLKEPIESPEEGQNALTHYTRSYYVAASNEAQALDIVKNDVAAGGAVLIDAEKPTEVNASQVPGSRFLIRAFRPRVAEVCWRSGRVFFPPE